MDDSYFNTFYDATTRERLDIQYDKYVYAPEIISYGNEEYLVVSVCCYESEYKDPYDGHSVDENYYQSIYVEKIGDDNYQQSPVWKDGGKYFVDVALKKEDKEDGLKKEIEKMLPSRFLLKEWEFCSYKRERPLHGVWVLKKLFGQISIFCKITESPKGYRASSGRASWYWAGHVSIWYTIDKFFGFNIGNKEKLDMLCRNIAQMIENKYKIRKID